MVAIFDIDGTLCAISEGRKQLIKQKEWDEFHKLAEFEPVNEPVKRLLQNYEYEGATIIINTGRPSQYRGLTKYWLAKNSIDYDTLFMRDGDDFRHSYEVKADIADIFINDERIAVDDREQDLRMYCAKGFKTIKIKGGQINESK